MDDEFTNMVVLAVGSKDRVRRGHSVAGSLLAMLLSLKLAACACTSSKPEERPTGTASEPAWQSLMTRLGPNGHVSRELALDAFATLVAPIRGGNRIHGDMGTNSGTMALRWLLRYWDELSADQRSSVLRVFESQTKKAPRATIKLSGSVESRQKEIQDLTDKVTTEFRAAHPAFAPLKAEAIFMSEAVIGEYAVTAAFLDNALVLEGEVNNCVIAYSPNLVKVLDRVAAGDGAALTAMKAIAAHELMHCHQINLVKDREDTVHLNDGHVEDYTYAPDWVTEGSALWGTYLFAYPSTAAPDSINYWKQFFDNSTTDLFKRTYDAVGFWSYAADAWKTLEHAMSRPWSSFDGLRLSTEVLANVERDQKLWRFGTSHARLPAFGPEWETSAPGLGGHRPPSAQSISLAAGQRHTSQVPLRGFHAAKVTFSSDVDVVLVTPVAAGALHWGEGDSDPDDIFNGTGGVLNFCIDAGGCPCPPGKKPRPGLFINRQGMSLFTFSAFGAREAGSEVVMETFNMESASDRFCSSGAVIELQRQKYGVSAHIKVTDKGPQDTRDKACHGVYASIEANEMNKKAAERFLEKTSKEDDYACGHPPYVETSAPGIPFSFSRSANASAIADEDAELCRLSSAGQLSASIETGPDGKGFEIQTDEVVSAPHETHRGCGFWNQTAGSSVGFVFAISGGPVDFEWQIMECAEEGFSSSANHDGVVESLTLKRTSAPETVLTGHDCGKSGTTDPTTIVLEPGVYELRIGTSLRLENGEGYVQDKEGARASMRAKVKVSPTTQPNS